MSRYAQARIPASPPVGIAHGPSGYTCPELRPYTARPGSMAAHQLPSRMNNRLHHRDGSVTRLDGSQHKEAE